MLVFDDRRRRRVSDKHFISYPLIPRFALTPRTRVNVDFISLQKLDGRSVIRITLAVIHICQSHRLRLTEREPLSSRLGLSPFVTCESLLMMSWNFGSFWLLDSGGG